MDFQKGSAKKVEYPVKDVSSLDVEGCELVSVRKGKKHKLYNPYTEKNTLFFYEEVLQVRKDVKAGVYPHLFMRRHYPWDIKHYPEYMPQPLYSAGLDYDNPEMCANIVHMDNPFDLPKYMQEWVNARGFKPRQKWYSRAIPKFIKSFIESVPQANRYITKRQDQAIEKGFEVKYYYGVVRPEEYGNLGPSATAYPEGCPCHPEYPAGHSCLAFAAAKAILDYYQIDDIKDVMVILNCAYNFSMFRSFALMHYGPSNVAGGELVGILPVGYMKKRYGTSNNN